MPSLCTIAHDLGRRSRVVVRVSIVIPTRNAGPGFERTLEAIAAQDLDEPYEVVVIDSGSTDGTPDLARRYGARVMRVERHSFHHARTRNLAIAHSTGDIVVLLVQDAVPANELWLTYLLEPLRNTSQVAGAYSRHVPRTGASFLARQVADYWYREQGETGRIQRLEPLACSANLTDRQRRRLFTFNSVSGAIRRDVWSRFPLPEVRYGEDLAWGYRVVREGYCLAYVPASCVIHSHERSLWYEFRRAYVDAKAIGELFGDPVEPLSTREMMTLLSAWVRLLVLVGRQQAVLEAVARGEMRSDLLAARALPNDLRSSILSYAADLTRLAREQNELTRDLAGAILRMACTLNIGQRIGRANRYGLGGRWGRIIDWLLARGV